MPTPHNTAERDQIAKTVIMPGDPQRSQLIAETMLEGAVLVNDVRGIRGYTGTYRGTPVTVMASGMGMPSMGIYSYELYKFYDVDRIIRVGTAGAYVPELHLFDIVLANSSWSPTHYALEQSGCTDDVMVPSPELNARLVRSAEELGITLHDGRLHCTDVFYSERPEYADEARAHGCCCVEMESFALLHNARVLGKQAACLISISDSFVNDEIATPDERRTKLFDMIKVALGAA